MELKTFLELSKIYGTQTVVLGILIWIHIINPVVKKRKGIFVTWKDMKKKQDEYAVEVEEIGMEVKDLRRVLDSQIERELEKDRRIDILQDKQDNFDRSQKEFGFVLRDISDSLKTSNRLIGENKDTNVKLIKILEDRKHPEGQ